MSDNVASPSQVTSTPNRPVNRNRLTKSSPQVPMAQSEKRRNNTNNRGRRSGNPNPNAQGQSQSQQRQESALTKKFREAASGDQGAASDSGVGSVINKGLATPPTTPGTSSGRAHSNAYISDSAMGNQTDRPNKKRNNNNNKKKGKRPTDINTSHVTPPHDPSNTPPDDVMFGQQTPSKPLYAGGCFHSSPAPNALPMPKFFSKSVPSTSDGPSLSKMLAEAEAAGLPDASSSSSSESPPQTAPLTLGTPLDIFFKADKEEKARRALQKGNQEGIIISPQPIMSSFNGNQPRRNITPPNPIPQHSLGSPFGDKNVSREDSDLLFSMEFPESKKPTLLRPAEEVVIGQRFRPLSSEAYDAETLVKRQEKAKALKAALMNQQKQTFGSKNIDIDGPPSPSPKPKAKTIAIPPSAENTGPTSPPSHNRRAMSNNVGFAPTPRIRHFNQNRPVSHRNNGYQQQDGKNPIFSHSSPHHTRTNQSPAASPVYDSKRAREAENFVRSVLKLDNPIPAN